MAIWSVSTTSNTIIPRKGDEDGTDSKYSGSLCCMCRCVCVCVCECSKGVRSSSNPNETSSMDLYWESTSGCITMASDVAFMHKYIYANRIAIPKRHDAGRDNIFIWIQMALSFSLPPCCSGKQVCSSSRLLVRISRVANAFSRNGWLDCFL